MGFSNFINDCISEKDYLGYLPYIESFEYLICNHEKLINLPIVFGIHGKWGVGKSTFMRLIKNRLNESNSFFTIELNPWEYGNDQNFISIFLAKLYERTKDELCDEEKGLEDPFVKFFKSIFKPLKLSAGIGVLKGEYDFSKLSFANQKNIVEEFISENFSMKEIIHDILNAEIFYDKKLVILIDDLDRCQPDKVIEVIESIKLVLDSKNCIFFLGCDMDYLESALSVKYQNFIKFLINEEDQKNEDSNYKRSLKSFSREYLEKIIQIPFHIPPLDENSIESFIECVLDKKDKFINHSDISEPDLYEEFKNQIKQEFISKLIIAANLNPRRIKRILNLIFLNYLFLKFKSEKLVDDNIDVSILSFLGFIRDVEQEYYFNYLSNKVMCKSVFSDFLHIYNNVSEFSENKDIDEQYKEEKSHMQNQKVKEYFKIYYKFYQLTESELEKKLLNIDSYISVSNMTTIEDYTEKSLEKIRNIKSEISDNKLEFFLDKIKNSETALDFVIWFFENIFDSKKFIFDLKSSINLFIKNNKGNDLEKNFILRIEYDEKDNFLYIRFERLVLKSIFFEKAEKLYAVKNYNKSKKLIEIASSLDPKTVEEIKKGFKLLFSDLAL